MCIVQSYIYKTNVSGMVKSESTVYLLIYIHISYMCKNNTEKTFKIESANVRVNTEFNHI